MPRLPPGPSATPPWATPLRLAIVDELFVSDRMPSELQALVELPSNLLAHHLDVLERVGLIRRTRSSGDGRRRYVHLHRQALDDLAPGAQLPPGPALFVCTHNSARSQVAAALWRQLTGAPADLGGHAPRRAGPPRGGGGRPAGRARPERRPPPPPRRASTTGRALVVTVCDRAHEEGVAEPGWLHWSIPDPVPVGTPAAFDATVVELRERISSLVASKAA